MGSDASAAWGSYHHSSQPALGKRVALLHAGLWRGVDPFLTQDFICSLSPMAMAVTSLLLEPNLCHCLGFCSDTWLSFGSHLTPGSHLLKHRAAKTGFQTNYGRNSDHSPVHFSMSSPELHRPIPVPTPESSASTPIF